MKQSWKDRAVALNNRPVPGLLADFPRVRLPGNLEDMVVEALRSDFTKLIKIMHRSIITDARDDVNVNKDIKYFGRPHFKLKLQTFRRNISVSKLLVNYLFGVEHNRYEQNIIKSTTRTVLWNIWSSQRMKEIFNIADLCGAQVFDTNEPTIRYSFCGKVIVSNVYNNKEIRGYVLEETPRFKVQLTNGNMIYIAPPVYDHDNNMWVFQHPCVLIGRVPYSILEYAPIRLLLSKRGYLSYTTHRHVCEVGPRNRLLIEPDHCS